LRAMGPGSVSSFLKVILDVVFAALWTSLAILGVVTVAALLVRFNPDLVIGLRAGADGAPNADITKLLANGANILRSLASAVLYLAAILVIVGSLRRIFMTLTAGDPFHPDNVARLRLIGLMLAALELGRYAFWALSVWVFPGLDRVEPSLSLTAWFSVLVVFVLAEVFREGARLRREAELTI
jgi:hypothetical protein